MQYKGYLARVEYDSDSNIYHGVVTNIRDIITFQADKESELEAEFHNSVDDYLEFCKLRGETPKAPS